MSTTLLAISSVNPVFTSIGNTIILFGSVLATSSISIPPLIEATIAGFYEFLSRIKAKYNWRTISTPSWTSTALTYKP